VHRSDAALCKEQTFFSLLMNILVSANAVVSFNPLDECSSFDFRICRQDSREERVGTEIAATSGLSGPLFPRTLSVTSEGNKQDIWIRISIAHCLRNESLGAPSN
jgi:hypothetical protein